VKRSGRSPAGRRRRASRRADSYARYAAPLVFLAAITIAVLLVRAGLDDDGGATSTTVPVSTAAATTSATGTVPERQPAKKPKPQYYVIESGDTFGTIAAKFATSVEALQALNPDVSSNSLTVGQRIRVK
jgi:LysM repeat protein